MIGNSSRSRSTTWTRHPLKRLLRRPRNLVALFAVGGAGAVVALGAMSAGAAPTNFLVLDGNIRNGAPAISYDWGNSGTTYGACAGGGIDAIGSKGIFNCGKPVAPSGTNTNPVPIAPTLTATAAADPTIVASAFVVDPLFNSTSKNTGLTCPVTGASTTGGDPTALITGASKNDLPLSGFVYAPTSLQPKDDLADVYAIAHRTPGVNEVFFGAERVINNGASHIDFEFLQSPVSLVPSGTTGSAACTGNLSGHRTGGDFLAAMDFSTGGSFGSATIYEWSCGGLASNIMQGTQCDPGSVGFPNAKYIVAPDASAFTIAFNGPATKGGTNNIPCGGWVCRGEMPTDNINTVSTNEFMEGGVDLKQLGFTGCVNTFLPHTRSSPDINSTLQDFAGPVNFNTCSIKTAPGAAVTDVRSASGISDTATVDGFIGTPGSVEFKLYGPFASASAIGLNSCTGTTVGTGNLIFDKVVGPGSQTGAPATYTATTPASPTSGYYQWVDSYSSPSGAVEAKSFCGDTSEQALLVDANIQIAPLTKANEVGTNHVLTAHVNVSNPPNAATSFVNAPAGTTINFTVTNSNGANATPATGSCTTIGTTGSCTFTITSSKPGQTTTQATTTVSVGGLALTRTTGDGFTDSANASKTWVDAYIALSPLTKTNEIKADHTLTASVFVNDGSGAGYMAAPNGTTVNFLVTNSNGATATPTSGSCNTSGGSCTFTINSPTAGTVGINASVSITVGGVTLNRSTGDGLSQDSANASKTYVDANINLSPPTRVNEVGKVHAITATVQINDGSGAGFGPAANGTLVTFSLANSNGATASFVAGSTCLTSGGTGQCSVQINSPTPGLVTINATTTLSVGGVSLTRSTGDSNAGDGSAVTKTYVDANINLSPPTRVNEVGKVHTITATVLINDGSGAAYGPAPDNTLVTLSLSNANGATASFVAGSTCLTSGGTGQCSVQINSPTPGLVTINATTTLSVGGVSLTRSTGDSNAGDGPAVTKTYVDANINLSPPAKTNAVGSAHTITATVLINDGSRAGFGPAADGTLVTFSLANSNGSSASFVGGVNTCATSAGSCSVQINSPTPGLVTINATTTLSVGGVSLTRSTDDSNASDGPVVTKTYVDANINLSPPSKTNAVGS